VGNIKLPFAARWYIWKPTSPHPGASFRYCRPAWRSIIGSWFSGTDVTI